MRRRLDQEKSQRHVNQLWGADLVWTLIQTTSELKQNVCSWDNRKCEQTFCDDIKLMFIKCNDGVVLLLSQVLIFRGTH